MLQSYLIKATPFGDEVLDAVADEVFERSLLVIHARAQLVHAALLALCLHPIATKIKRGALDFC